MAIQIVHSIYRVFLHLYSPAFQAQFGDEMMEVFSEAASEANLQGSRALKELCLNELRDLPVTALRERLGAERIKKPDSFSINPLDWQSPLSRGEILLAIAAFLVPAVLVLANSTFFSLPMASLIRVALAFTVIAFLLGMVKGFPRWSFPYLGMGLCVAGYLFLFQWTADLISPQLLIKLELPFWHVSTGLLWQIISVGLVWLGLFIITILFLALLALLPRFRPLYLSIRRDWTQVSLILYSEMAIALVLLFEDYRIEEPYGIASLLFMAAGAWLFMRRPLPCQRVLFLLGGLSLALWVVATDRWQALPDLRSAAEFHWQPLAPAQRLEAYPVLLHWAWMSAVLLLPVLIKLLPRRGRLEDEDLC